MITNSASKSSQKKDATERYDSLLLDTFSSPNSFKKTWNDIGAFNNNLNELIEKYKSNCDTENMSLAKKLLTTVNAYNIISIEYMNDCRLDRGRKSILAKGYICKFANNEIPNLAIFTNRDNSKVVGFRIANPGGDEGLHVMVRIFQTLNVDIDRAMDEAKALQIAYAESSGTAIKRRYGDVSIEFGFTIGVDLDPKI